MQFLLYILQHYVLCCKKSSQGGNIWCLFWVLWPLRQYLSQYRAVSQRIRKKKNDRREQKHPINPHPHHRKRSRPLIYHYPNLQDVPSLEVYPALSHHPTAPKRGNNQEPSIIIIGNIFPISVIGIKQIAKRLSFRKSQI